MRTLFLAMILCSCSQAVDEEDRGYGVVLDASSDAPESSTLIINEVAPKGRPDDWFEVYNGTDRAIDLAYYRYSDGPERSPVGFSVSIVLEPGQYYVEFLSDAYPGFGLGNEEQIQLYVGSLFLEQLQWTAADMLDDGSLARLPDVVGSPLATSRATPGYPNAPADMP
jgi:hypothetical protein